VPLVDDQEPVETSAAERADPPALSIGERNTSLIRYGDDVEEDVMAHGDFERFDATNDRPGVAAVAGWTCETLPCWVTVLWRCLM